MDFRDPYSPAAPTRKASPALLNGTAITFMTIRTRKFFGTIALLVLAIVWSLVAMAIAQLPFLADSKLLQAAYYVVAGLGWVLPAMPIISWMSRPDI
jgi:hypothetical protein